MSYKARIIPLAVLMIVLGVISMGLHAVDLIDNPLPTFTATSTVAPPEPESMRMLANFGPPPIHHSDLQPRGDEWPLMLAKEFEPGHYNDSYSLQVGLARNTHLIEFTVSSSSPERAHSLATWMAGQFASSLHQSYVSRNIPSDGYERPSAWSLPELSPIHSSWSVLYAAFQFVAPAFLFGAGIVLLRMRS